jgi:hypothetical protein
VAQKYFVKVFEKSQWFLQRLAAAVDPRYQATPRAEVYETPRVDDDGPDKDAGFWVSCKLSSVYLAPPADSVRLNLPYIPPLSQVCVRIEHPAAAQNPQPVATRLGFTFPVGH